MLSPRGSLVEYYLDLTLISRCYDLQMDALPPGSLSLPNSKPLSSFGYPARRAEIQSQRVNGSKPGEK